MKKQSAKKWTILTLAAILLILVAFAAFMYFTDPLLYFRKESGPITYWHYDQLYSGPGVATQYDYDTVVTGSSMIGGFDTTQFDALYNAKTVKLTYNEATAHNDKAILDVCFETHPNIKRVFLPIDSFTCIYAPDKYNCQLPDYLYNKTAAGSMKYLLNLNIFYHISVTDVINTIQGEIKPAMESKPKNENYGTQWVSGSRLIPWDETEDFDTTDYLTNTEANLVENILPVIEAHPETEFIFFTPPYSMLYWYRRMGTGDAVASLESMRKMIGTCLMYDNVKIYGFSWDESITTHLENYKDSGHFSPEIHTGILNRMYYDEDRVTTENYNQLIDDFIERVETFDYTALYNSYADVK